MNIKILIDVKGTSQKLGVFENVILHQITHSLYWCDYKGEIIPNFPPIKDAIDYDYLQSYAFAFRDGFEASASIQGMACGA